MKRAIWMGTVLLALAWLLAGRRGDLREFNPHEVARLEQEMWRSYYEHRPVALFGQLYAVLREQYGLSPLQASITAAHAARAAVVFQKGHGRPEYELALRDLRAYYGAILDREDSVDRAARLELEWWIVHRERDRHAREDLDHSLAALQAEIYARPAAAFSDHARWRAEAMVMRDQARNPSEEQWREIRRALDRSWTALWNELHDL